MINKSKRLFLKTMLATSILGVGITTVNASEKKDIDISSPKNKKNGYQDHSEHVKQYYKSL